jgi:hypothetical protein
MGKVITMTLQEFRPHGTTGNGEHEDMFYHEEITGPQGARYHLFKEKHHNSENLAKAKAWLKRNLDVVKIYITEEK